MIVGYVHGARGCDLIPHLDFWKSIPGGCWVSCTQGLRDYVCKKYPTCTKSDSGPANWHWASNVNI